MAYACLHLQYTEESLQRYNNLTAAWLPEDSPHVKSQKAMVYYNARGEGTRIAGVVCVCVWTKMRAFVQILRRLVVCMEKFLKGIPNGSTRLISTRTFSLLWYAIIQCHYTQIGCLNA